MFLDYYFFVFVRFFFLFLRLNIFFMQNKNISTKIVKSLLFILLLFSLSVTNQLYSQTYITWNQGSGSILSGTFPGGTVSVTQTGTGNGISITSPATYQNNLLVTGNKTFSTFGPASSGNSKKITFTFSTPVVITKYNMTDIDNGFSWNDTFNFENIVFSNVNAVDCNATVSGAIATTSSGIATEYAQWTNNTTPITTFSLNYLTTVNLTHAYLGYSIEVMLPDSTNNVTVNSPTVCAGSLTTVSTTNSLPGNYSYVWTVPTGATNPGDVSSFLTGDAGTYSVIATNTGTGIASPSASGLVTISPNNTPQFIQVQPICSGENLSNLPLTSLNSITGSWSPALDNTQTTTYIFTPSGNSCATSTSMTIVVNPNTIPLFIQVQPICEGETLANLATTSLNNITGTWSPIINNNQTTTYTFLPNSGNCSSTTSMTIVVNPSITPQFNQIQPICEGEFLSNLTTTSLNNIIGSWSPPIDNTQTTTYTFTPNDGSCTVSYQMTIVVNPKITPTFNIDPILCFGTTTILPTLSNENIIGTWSPSLNTTQSTTYTFTPNSGECANTTTFLLDVTNDFDFEINNFCDDGNFMLEVLPVSNSFEASNMNYQWFYNNNNIANQNLFDVSSYVKSNPNNNISVPISFDVMVTDTFGCSKSKSITVESIFCNIQKGISPNNDDKNDFFDLRYLNVKHLSVFNRYGLKLYEKDNYLKEWYGQSTKGDELPTGVYYYVIEFNSNTPIETGWIYINR